MLEPIEESGGNRRVEPVAPAQKIGRYRRRPEAAPDLPTSENNGEEGDSVEISGTGRSKLKEAQKAKALEEAQKAKALEEAQKAVSDAFDSPDSPAT
jgi:hypothetical protein